MPSKSTDEELRATAPAREAQRRVRCSEEYLQTLELARALARRAGIVEPSINALTVEIERGRTYLKQQAERAGGTIHPRKRPKAKESTGLCHIYLDECGSHDRLSQPGDFGAFVLAAVLLRDEDRAAVEQQWSAWKKRFWGNDAVVTHEPEVRRRKYRWAFGGDSGRQRAAEVAMNDMIKGLPFKAIVVVVRRDAYFKEVGSGSMESLPASIYHMALDFMCERIVLALESDFGGAKGIVHAESRGPKEDASLQYEFVRLQLEGTSYIADGWFRQQLSPSIQFKRKDENLAGLQLADLLARPCGEKILHPDSVPERWREFGPKLVQAKATLHSPLGLKIVPWDESFADVWKI